MGIINKLKKKLRIDFDKNTKLNFYLRGLWILCSPKFLYKKDLDEMYNNLNAKEKQYIDTRVLYYNKIDSTFEVAKNTKTIKEFIKKEKKKTYFFDLLEYLKYFDYNNKISYLFGDIVQVPKVPTIVKSRPISDNNQNSILMKLNKVRHFIFVDDKVKFEDKKDMAVWRGKCYRKHRQEFVKKFYNSPLCNIGQVNTKGEVDVPWQKGKLSLKEQLEYKFLIAIEGNDVASNLKWAMSSNSLVMMAKPHYETWFMEGTLKQNFHYVLVKDDYSDLEEKIKYYSTHIEEAKKIIENAKKYANQFKNNDYEDIISYKVLDKYFGRVNE